MTATDIERDDTVRFIGRCARWEVTHVNGDTIGLVGCWGNPRRGGERIIVREARRDQIELVRKGNRDKDIIDAMFAKSDVEDAYRAGTATLDDVKAAAANLARVTR